MVGVALQSELRAICFTDHACATTAELHNRQFVSRRNEIGVEPTAPGRPKPALRNVVLHANRHAVEGPDRGTVLPSPFTCLCRGTGAFKVECHDRIDNWINFFDTIEDCVYDLDGRPFAARVAEREF